MDMAISGISGKGTSVSSARPRVASPVSTVETVTSDRAHHAHPTTGGTMTNPTPAALAKARTATTRTAKAKAEAATNALETAVADALAIDGATFTSEAPSAYHGVSVTVPLSVLTGALMSADRSEERISAGFTWLRLQWLALAHHKVQAKQVTGPDSEPVSLAAVVRALNLASDKPVTKSTLSNAARVYGYVGALGFDVTARDGEAFAQAAPVARTLRTLVDHTRKDVLDDIVKLAVEVPMSERGAYIADKGKAARIKAEENRGIAAGSKGSEAAAGKAAAALLGGKAPVADGQNTGGSVPADASGKVVNTSGLTLSVEAGSDPILALSEMLAAATAYARNHKVTADSAPAVRVAFDGLADALGLGA